MYRVAGYLPIMLLSASVCWPQSTLTSAEETTALKAELVRERAALEEQRKALDEQERRLHLLEERLTGVATVPANDLKGPAAVNPNGVAQVATDAAPVGATGVEPVGVAPTEPARPPPIAALGDQGGVITRRNRLTIEGDFEYAHADRNEVIFRGIEVPQSVLVGVFDINESRQDILTAAVVSRYGLTNRLEANLRIPYIYRTDSSALPPIDSSADTNVGSQSTSAHALHVGDAEFGLRYQFTDGRDGSPFLIGGLQVLTPSGTSPYTVPRDPLGNPIKAATGAGFWAVSPSLTALLPTDPAVLFGSLGYTANFGRDINRMIGNSFIERVRPGGEPTFNFGIGISLNPRTAVSFAYAHIWSFGSKTRASVLSAGAGAPMLTAPIESTTRDLQIGQYIFGVSYRINEKKTLNWNVAIGATDDAPAVVTTFRMPFGFDF